MALESIGCFERGTCVDSFIVASTVVGKVIECQDFCLDNPDCNFWSFATKAGSCSAFSECNAISRPACRGVGDLCFSSDAECGHRPTFTRDLGDAEQLDTKQFVIECLGPCQNIDALLEVSS